LFCLHHTGWIKTRPAQKPLVRVKFTGNSYSYRICVNVNGHYWNTRIPVFTGTRMQVPGLVLVPMWMHPQYQRFKYQYKYQYLACKYKYKYRYSTVVLKYRSSTSTSTQYNKTVTYGQWMLVRCVSGTCLLQVVEKFLQLKDPTTFVLSPMMIKTVSYLYAVSTTSAFVPTACQNSLTQ